MTDRIRITGSQGPGVYEGTLEKEDGTRAKGVFRSIREGQSIPPEHELMSINAIEDNGYTLSVTNHGKVGPAQVNSKAYRVNYDAIFRKAN